MFELKTVDIWEFFLLIGEVSQTFLKNCLLIFLDILYFVNQFITKKKTNKQKKLIKTFDTKAICLKSGNEVF